MLANRSSILGAFLSFALEDGLTEFSKSGARAAYLSTAWPILYQSVPNASAASAILAISGFLIATFAAIDLGPSFGASPAARGRVHSGIYSRVRHPMYFGYLVAEGGWLIQDPANFPIWLCALLLYVLRAQAEDRVLALSALQRRKEVASSASRPRRTPKPLPFFTDNLRLSLASICDHAATCSQEAWITIGVSGFRWKSRRG